jgi:hypothetical protein
MNDKVDELASDIDDAVRTTEELENEPGEIDENSIKKVKTALDKAHDVVSEMEDTAD